MTWLLNSRVSISKDDGCSKHERALGWGKFKLEQPRSDYKPRTPDGTFWGHFMLNVCLRSRPPNSDEHLNDRTNEALDNPRRLRLVERLAASTTTMINNDFASKSSRILAFGDVARMTGLLATSEDKWIVTESQRTRLPIIARKNSNLFCFSSLVLCFMIKST